MYKNALNIGTLAGIVAFALFLALYYVGLSPLSVPRLLGMPIPVIAIIWAVYKTRKEVMGGYITGMQAFTVGSLTVLIWCTFKAFCIYIFITAFDQHVIEQYLQFTKDYFEFSEAVTKNDYSSLVDMAELKEQATPQNLMMGDISNNILFGSMVAVIISFILRKMPKTKV